MTSVRFRFGGRRRFGCFLARLIVSRLKRAALSKSSTLTNVLADRHQQERDSMLLVQKNGLVEPARTVSSVSPSFSGSNQAREGRLVNALAARGDEGRDTLR